MNTEEITKLIDEGIISKEFYLRHFDLWVDCDEERMMEIEIEEYENV